MDKTLKALVAFVLAEDPETQKEAKQELVRFLQEDHSGKKKVSEEYIIRKVLLNNGVPEHLSGYPYMIRAIQLIIEDRKNIDNITHGLYAKLAKEFHKTPSQIERAIRDIIVSTYSRIAYSDNIKHLANPDTGKATNGEFLARMSNLVKLELWE